MLCIIDYGSGNIAAIENICRRERITYKTASTPAELTEGTHFILPGVGAFDPTMRTLEESGLMAELEKQVFEHDKPVLGICVGMQLLAEGSEEGERPGLGWIPGQVRRIDPTTLTSAPRLPHMGWNSLDIIRDHPILDGIDAAHGLYFLHTYYFDATSDDDVMCRVDYGRSLPCLVHRGNVYGSQFHPEKSHSNGIRFISNFAKLASC